MGSCISAESSGRKATKSTNPGILPDDVNRLLDRWSIGHVMIIRKRFNDAKPSPAGEIGLNGFRSMFSDLDQTIAHPAVCAAFRQFDTRHAGALTFRDVCFGLATTCISSWEVRARFLFYWFGTRDRLSRSEFESILLAVVAAIRRASSDGDETAFFQSLPISPRKTTAPALDRIQSCVTAVQSEVCSLAGDTHSLPPGGGGSVLHDVTAPEQAWIDHQLNSLFGEPDFAPTGVDEDTFVRWSINVSVFLLKLFELFEIVPSPDKERRICLTSLRRHPSLELGATWYVVSYKWIQLWRSYVRWSETTDSTATVWNRSSFLSTHANSALEVNHAHSTLDLISCTSSLIHQRLSERPPPIMNADIEGELKGALLPNIVEHHDYVVVPEDMWKHLFEWYGGGPSFPRKVIFQPFQPSKKLHASFTHRCIVDLYPPLIVVVVCGERGVPVRHFAKRFFVSRSDSVADLIDQLSRKFSLIKSKCRLWHRRRGEDWERVGGDGDTRTVEELVVDTPVGMFMVEPQGKDGKWPRDGVVGKTAVMDELQVGDRVDAAPVVAMAAANGNGGSRVWRRATVVDVSGDSVKVHFDREPYRSDIWLSCDSDEIAPFGTHTGGGRKWLSSRAGSKVVDKFTPHVFTGLENIGNTCFMNAVLQCLCWTPLLRDFFLQPQAPPTTKLVSEFASLMSAMTSGGDSVVAPTAFKKALDKYSPRFLGYEHQDAHELLAVLLDGLHEDLNVAGTSSAAAVTAVTTTTTSGKEVIVESGIGAWEKHRQCNTSVISDLFDGQQQVVCGCKICGFTSTLFESFRYVMLPIPVTDKRYIGLTFVPSDTTIPLVSVSVEVRREGGNWSDVVYELSRKYPELSEKLQIDWESGILIAEVYMSRIHRVVDAATPLSEFRSEDKVFVFQSTSPPTAPTTSATIPPVSGVYSLDSFTAAGVSSAGGGGIVPGRPRLSSTEWSASGGPLMCYAQIVHRRQGLSSSRRNTGRSGGGRKREIFGLPIIIAVNPKWSSKELYGVVKKQMNRFDSAGLSGSSGGSYVLRVTGPDGLSCSTCGSSLTECDECVVAPTGQSVVAFKGNWLYLAVDWRLNGYDASGEIPVQNSSIVARAEKATSGTGAGGVAATGAVGGKTAVSSITLLDCLDAYTGVERLLGDNQWFCEKCKVKVDAERRIAWSVAPDVLVVLLKRFQFTSAGLEKLNVGIDFPLTDLRLKNANGVVTTYDLYGVVNHYGSLSSGHYTAMCLDAVSGQWSLFNDHKVTSLGGKEVERTIRECARSCYVLFYKHKGPFRTANVINYASHTSFITNSL